MKFEFERIEGLPDLILVQGTRFGDDRGWFSETFRKEDFASNGIATEFKQDNMAFSAAVGTLRGIHFQRDPKPQGKLLSCLAGKIWDLAVDLRRSSPTFGKWHGVELAGGDDKQFWVPPGFGHAYITLGENTLVSYKVTEYYDPQLDAGVRWNDPDLGVNWPLDKPILSGKDEATPFVAEAELFA